MPGFGTYRDDRVAALRHTGELQNQPETTTDDRGRIVGDWVKVDTLRFGIKRISSAEIESARQLYPESTHRIKVRADSRITETMRIVFGDRTFYIGAVDDFHAVGRMMALLVAENH
jgi:SPP1 family predicted phage head-tail adaptor